MLAGSPICATGGSLGDSESLRQELKESGYRLIIAIHPKEPQPGESAARDLYFINADGTGLMRITNTPQDSEHMPRVSPDGTKVCFIRGDNLWLLDLQTMQEEKLPVGAGSHAWGPDSKEIAVDWNKPGIGIYNLETKKIRAVGNVRGMADIDWSPDGKWFIFEIRDYKGVQYTIDFMSADGGEVRKLPNYGGQGECHPCFSRDGRWHCWNAGDGLSIRRFAPELPEGTEGQVKHYGSDFFGQDPCGRWSRDDKYIAFVCIPSEGSWKVHSPIRIVRVSDGESIQLNPPGTVGHHWDYDWLLPKDAER
jgi:Tol biopolymer transport system component